MVELTDICKTSPKEILCIDKTKLDSSFPNAQVHLPDHQFPPFWRDRNLSGGGKLVYIRSGITTKSLTVYETKNWESICAEITFKKRKWRISFSYRPPTDNNLKLLFEETTQSANQLPSKFENIIIAGDFNIDTGSKNYNKFKQFAEFCHTFNLTNQINIKTCFLSQPRLSLLWMLLWQIDQEVFRRQPLLPQGSVITIKW